MGEYAVEKVTVSHSLRESTTSGSPGIPGDAFTSWTIGRRDGEPMSIDEARLVSLETHLTITKISLLEAVSRNVMGKMVAEQIKSTYISRMEPVLKALRKKVGDVAVDVEMQQGESLEAPTEPENPLEDELSKESTTVESVEPDSEGFSLLGEDSEKEVPSGKAEESKDPVPPGPGESVDADSLLND